MDFQGKCSQSQYNLKEDNFHCLPSKVERPPIDSSWDHRVPTRTSRSIGDHRTVDRPPLVLPHGDGPDPSGSRHRGSLDAPCWGRVSIDHHPPEHQHQHPAQNHRFQYSRFRGKHQQNISKPSGSLLRSSLTSPNAHVHTE